MLVTLQLKLDPEDKVVSLQILEEEKYRHSYFDDKGYTIFTMRINLYSDPVDYLGLKVIDLLHIKQRVKERFNKDIDLISYISSKLKAIK